MAFVASPEIKDNAVTAATAGRRGIVNTRSRCPTRPPRSPGHLKSFLFPIVDPAAQVLLAQRAHCAVLCCAVLCFAALEFEPAEPSRSMRTTITGATVTLVSQHLPFLALFRVRGTMQQLHTMPVCGVIGPTA